MCFQVSNKSKRKKKRRRVDIDSESDGDLDELEALLVGRIPRGKGKYRCKLPFICYMQ